MRVKAIVEYDGSEYCGFQSQPNCQSIQSVIESALESILGHKVAVVGSGRTDAGVHAMAQVIHFDTTKDFDWARLPLAMNAVLPNDIALLSAEIVQDDFHARYGAVAKTYIYKVVQSRINRPLYYNRYYIYPYVLNVDKIRDAVPKIVGEHDFASFMSVGSNVKNTVRNVSRLEVIQEGECIQFVITANGFLYNMVRIIVGTLLDIGRGRLDIGCIEDMLGGKAREKGGATAPACGLYLRDVQY